MAVVFSHMQRDGERVDNEIEGKEEHKGMLSV